MANINQIEIILLSLSIASISAQSKYDIPSWVKGVAGYWAEGKITDADFGEGLTFLVDNEIIKIPKIQELQNKINQLQSENANLRSQLNLSKSDTGDVSTNKKSQISVSTNLSKYTEGDTIIISGKTSTLTNKVTIQIFNQGNLIDVAQFNVAEDGSYSYAIIAEGSYWSKSGEYTVRASYGEENYAETKFSLSPKTAQLVTDSFQVQLNGNGIFDVYYGIKGGLVKNIEAEPNNYALIVTIQSTEDGSISLEIPRKSFDAKKQDKTDDTFIIIIDGTEAPYQEIVTNSYLRTVKIDFENGDSVIKIIGNTIHY